MRISFTRLTWPQRKQLEGSDSIDNNIVFSIRSDTFGLREWEKKETAVENERNFGGFKVLKILSTNISKIVQLVPCSWISFSNSLLFFCTPLYSLSITAITLLTIFIHWWKKLKFVRSMSTIETCYKLAGILRWIKSKGERQFLFCLVYEKVCIMLDI